jgi:formate hydrogenlyase subunit 3/multisubunit Na+/H+ antiporter MnhD subunit
LAAVGSYALAAISAAVFNKKKKLANIIPNILCIFGALNGIVLALQNISGTNGKIDILDLKMPVDLISIHIQLDSLSAFFVLGLSILVLCVSIYSIGYLTHYYDKKNIGLFNFLYSTFIISMLLVITAGNMVFFFIAWEVMSMVSYFLVVFESENKETRKAGTLYIIMMHVGTAFLMLAFMILFSYSGSFDMSGHAAPMSGLVRSIVFILFLIGFGTKAGIIPLHIWLPYAHPAASSNVSALMSGIMIKTAIMEL